jgi:hypothetical protein
LSSRAVIGLPGLKASRTAIVAGGSDFNLYLFVLLGIGNLILLNDY